MMLKQRFPALMILILLVSLTWLLMQTQAINLDQHYQILNQLRSLKTIDAVVNTDLLKIRFGLVGNYDPLVLHWQQFHGKFQTVNQQFSTFKQTPKQQLSNRLKVLEKAIERKDTEIERFKSQNSVLFNSLRYLPIAGRDLIVTQSNLAATVNQLLQDTLTYNLDANEDLRLQISSTLSQLETQPQPLDIAPKVENVILHGKAILRLQSEVEKHITTLLSLPIDQALNDLAVAYEQYYKQLLQAKNIYQILLYLVTIALLICGAVLLQTYQKAKQIKTINQLLEQKVDEQTQELRQTLQTLQQSQAQLIHAEKMTGLGQLVAGIAHEVNNPISFIHGNLTYVRDYTDSLLNLVKLYQRYYPDPILEINEAQASIDIDFLKTDLPNLLKSMEVGTSRIREIVLSLRTFSRKDEATYKAVNLQDGIDSTLLILEHRLKATTKRSTITVQKHYCDLPLIQCHAGQINQVFMNLIANAIDALEEATEPQPMITIQTEIVQAGHSTPSVRVRIADNGSGIPEEIQSRLFEPFFTTKPVGKGTGLGLSVSYQIITEQHRGSLECFSRLGQGTEFVLTIPMQQS